MNASIILGVVIMYDLEERTYKFAKDVAIYCKQHPRISSSIEFTIHAIRSSGSIGANYIEANEALSKKDFIMRVKICRKEAKETAYWLRLLIETSSEELIQRGQELWKEAIELKKIFCAIVSKVT